MTHQLELTLASREDREAALEASVAPLGLTAAERLVLRLFAGRGELFQAGGQSAARLAASRRQLAAWAACGPNTWARGVERLEARGIVWTIAATRPWTYVVNWSRLFAMAPPRHQTDTPPDEFFDPEWRPSLIRSDPPRSALIRSDPGTETVNTENLKPVNPRPCPRPAPRGGGGRLLDASDDAVRRLRAEELKPWFADAVTCGWLADTLEDRTKFLATVHHAATAPGIRSPARVAYAAIRQYSFERLGQASWDWAAERLRGTAADQPRRPAVR